MEFERYIPEFKKYDTILFLHQPMTSGQPLKIVQRNMAHPVVLNLKNQSVRLKLKALPILLSFVTASSDVFGILIKILD